MTRANSGDFRERVIEARRTEGRLRPKSDRSPAIAGDDLTQLIVQVETYGDATLAEHRAR
jgi:hypothetical protein